MCTDDKVCGDDDDAGSGVSKTLAMLHGPGMERSMDRFIEHMRQVIPDFAVGVDRQVLLVVFSAGRTDVLKYVLQHTDTLCDASNVMTAMVLANYSERRGLDVDTMNANLDRVHENHRKETAS